MPRNRQWMWLIWQNDCFWQQRPRVQIRLQLNFLRTMIPHVQLFWKDKNSQFKTKQQKCQAVLKIIYIQSNKYSLLLLMLITMEVIDLWTTMQLRSTINTRVLECTQNMTIFKGAIFGLFFFIFDFSMQFFKSLHLTVFEPTTSDSLHIFWVDNHIAHLNKHSLNLHSNFLYRIGP